MIAAVRQRPRCYATSGIERMFLAHELQPSLLSGTRRVQQSKRLPAARGSGVDASSVATAEVPKAMGMESPK